MSTRQLATLKIYLDPEITDESSTSRMTGPGEWEITLKPNNTLQPNHEEQEYPIDALAHEMGHFISQLFDLPEHTKFALSQFLGIPWPMAPKEAEAWHIGEKINPAIKGGPFERAALQSYRVGDAFGER